MESIGIWFGVLMARPLAMCGAFMLMFFPSFDYGEPRHKQGEQQ
jgi:hypothetical protein